MSKSHNKPNTDIVVDDGDYDDDDEEVPPRAAYDLHRLDLDDTATGRMMMMQQQQQQQNQYQNFHSSNRDNGGDASNNHHHHRQDDAMSSSSEAYLDIHTASAGGDSVTVVTAAHIAAAAAGQQHQDQYHHHNPVTAAASSSNNLFGMSSSSTDVVHEMHLALLYLLSNPEEFERAVQYRGGGGAMNNNNTTTLAQWNADYGDTESLYTTDETESVAANQQQQQSPQRLHSEKSNGGSTNTANGSNSSSSNTTTPLPYAVFCDDAEVVLPQAHTASQLFGLETVTGMELEAAAGVPAICQLFLRWLALMPGGDHLNLIDPPGLTVMPIAGGRYRVTAAHRVVWTWMNEFAPVIMAPNSTNNSTSDAQKNASLSRPAGGAHTLQVGDLVSMTVVDVFESDNQGKLLSYCPTFDNRAVVKTDRTAHAIRKKTGALKSALKTAQNSKLALAVSKYTNSLALQVQQRVSDAVQGYNASSQTTTKKERLGEDTAFAGIRTVTKRDEGKQHSIAGTSMYMGDDDMERHEV